MDEKEKFKCPLCKIPKEFDTLAELNKHLSKKHGIRGRKREKLYKRMGIEE